MIKPMALLCSLLLISYFVFPSELVAVDTYLIRNMEDKASLPRNFRMSTAIVDLQGEDVPSFEGLAELNISGSGQFSKKSLEKVIEAIPNWNITVVDLRQEPHAFLNYMAVTWYSDRNWTNTGMTLDQIELDQLERIQQLKEASKVLVYDGKHQEESFSVTPKIVESEQEISVNLGLGYVRITATDHIRPSDQAVDDFVAFVKTMEEGTWLHLHCSAGRGRTTTFMALYDMMKNSGKVSLEDIVKRQKLIGGLDLFEMSDDHDHWQTPHVAERAQLVREFYQYCLENPNFSITWSKWRSKD